MSLSGLTLTNEWRSICRELQQNKDSVAELQKVNVSLQQKLEEAIALVLEMKMENAALQKRQLALEVSLCEKEEALQQKQLALEVSLREKQDALVALSTAHMQLASEFNAHKENNWFSRLLGQK
jgi:hypothetical protein